MLSVVCTNVPVIVYSIYTYEWVSNHKIIKYYVYVFEYINTVFIIYTYEIEAKMLCTSSDPYSYVIYFFKLISLAISIYLANVSYLFHLTFFSKLKPSSYLFWSKTYYLLYSLWYMVTTLNIPYINYPPVCIIWNLFSDYKIYFQQCCSLNILN